MSSKNKNINILINARDKASATFGKVGNSAGRMLSVLKSAPAMIAGALGVGGLGAALGVGVKLSAEFEQAEVAFTTLLGSADAAKQVIGDLSDFAASTPFQFPSLKDAARSLVAFGVEQKALIPTLRAVGDVAAGIGAPIGDIAEIYGKARVQGRLFMEDINQLTGRGIPIIQELAKQFGVAESEVRNLVSTGSVNFGHLQRAFVDLTSDGGKFTGMMDAQSKTAAGLWSTLKDNAGLAAKEVADNFMPLIKNAMTRSIEAIADFRAGFGDTVASLSAIVGVAKGFIGSFTETIVGGVQRVVSFVAPVMEALQGVFVSQMRFIGEAIADGFAAIGSLVSAIAPSMDTLGRMMTDLRNTYIIGLTAIEVGFTNWRSVIELTTQKAMLAVVRTVGEITHTFTVVAPAAVEYLSNNWRAILTDLFNFTRTLFTNLAGNIANVVKNLPDLIRGNMSLGDIWKPLAEGFESSLSELPDIAARQKSDLEKMLEVDITANESKLGSQFSALLQKRFDRINEAMQDAAGDSEVSIKLAPEFASLKALLEKQVSVPKGEKATKADEGEKLPQLVTGRLLTGMTAAFQSGQGRNNPNKGVEDRVDGLKGVSREMLKTMQDMRDVLRRGGGTTLRVGSI